MIEIVSVRFNDFGKEYYFNPNGLTLVKNDKVVVETAKGLEYGTCMNGNHMVDDNLVVSPLRPVVRVATDEDNRNYESGKEKEKEAFEYCQKKIVDFGLEMKLINVEYGFEGNKIMFFFTSDGRVDFRELVKDLAGMFKARIELRQIGVRDEAKMLGGLGVCGKQFCCSQYLTEFHPVSIKMAKTQGLSLNPAKISGTCGRLMCCLKYEEAAYEDLIINAPKIGTFVETPSGKGSVININILRRQAKVRLEDGFDTTLKTFSFDELDILGGKGRRAEYVAAKAEGRLEEAGFTVSPPPAAGRFETGIRLEQSGKSEPIVSRPSIFAGKPGPAKGPQSAGRPESGNKHKSLNINDDPDLNGSDGPAIPANTPRAAKNAVKFEKFKMKKPHGKKRKGKR